MSELTAWTGRIEVRCVDRAGAERLYRVLRPESAREVPRARAELEDPTGPEVVLRLEARDTGALRAAVQTFLGWVQLSETAAARASERRD